jgi:hypothetical protein
VHQATDGRIDLFAGDKVRKIARFGLRMEMQPGVYPAFADCRVGSRPSTDLSAFLSRRFGWGLGDVESRGLLLAVGPSSGLFELGIYGFANSATAQPPATSAAPVPIRDWFPDAGILIGRPGAGNSTALAVAIKGGHNAEHHNHNDVGSFLVAVGGKTPLVDPGSEIYTARTFSSNRYDSGVLNSFGHPVPLVAGQMQRSGGSAAAKMLETKFADDADTLLLDLSAAYDVKSLEELTRRFTFSRAGQGSLTVTDRVRFATPQRFGTALVTFSPWRKLSAHRLLVGEGAKAVEVRIAAEGSDVAIGEEKIEEDLSGGRIPVRLGIDLIEPVTEATITLTITPAGD